MLVILYVLNRIFWKLWRGIRAIITVLFASMTKQNLSLHSLQTWHSIRPQQCLSPCFFGIKNLRVTGLTSAKMHYALQNAWLYFCQKWCKSGTRQQLCNTAELNVFATMSELDKALHLNRVQYPCSLHYSYQDSSATYIYRSQVPMPDVISSEVGFRPTIPCQPCSLTHAHIHIRGVILPSMKTTVSVLLIL